MAENETKPLPQFQSRDELVDFFETHDLGEYEDDLPEAQFEVDLQRSHYLVSVDEQLMNRLLEVAKAQQVSVEMLVGSWLEEKLLQAS